MEGDNLSLSIILEYLKGPNKMQQLETNVED